MVQNIIRSKGITQIVIPTEQIIRRDSNKNFDDWYYQDRIAYPSERDKFDDRYHYRDQGSYDGSPKVDSYDRYCRDSHTICHASADHLLSCQLHPTFPPAWKEQGTIRL